MQNAQLKLIALCFLLLSVLSSPTQAQEIMQETLSGNTAVTVLAQGSQSSLEEPFLLVARDAKVYAALRVMVNELPERDDAYFEQHAVIAAFAGQRRSGGYSVAITRRKNMLVVKEQTPAPGGMVTQALTSPFAVVEVSAESDEILDISFDSAWRNALQTYRVTQGEFQFAGGFAGEREQFYFTGRLQTLTHGELVTFVSDLQSTGNKQPRRSPGVSAKKPRRLNNIATGFVNAQKVTVPYFHAGEFVPPPGNVLIASGEFDSKKRQLKLTFGHRPNNIADGYEGKGQLIARR